MLVCAALGVSLSCQSETLRLQHLEVPSIELPERVPASPLRLATFNAGLAPGAVRHAAARAPAVMTALANEPLDVLCVQEVWLEEHWNALRSATGARLPHALRPPARSDGGTKPCTAAEIAPVARCALQSCWSEGSAGAAECALASCGHLAKSLSAECVGCLSRHPMRRVGEILDDCVDPDLTRGASNSKQALRFFDGSYGIGLLSARPLSRSDRLELTAAHHPRAVLHAELEVGERPLHLFCTHLTPILRGIPHPSGSSWEAEQSAQVDALLDWVDAKAGDEPAIVLGDLNTGPGVAAIRARTPEHYARFVRRGFINPYLDATPSCTFCYDNPVIGSGRSGLLLDHVLFRGVSGRAEARRFLDGRVELAIDGKRRPMALSDHYGIAVTLFPEP